MQETKFWSIWRAQRNLENWLVSNRLKNKEFLDTREIVSTTTLSIDKKEIIEEIACPSIPSQLLIDLLK